MRRILLALTGVLAVGALVVALVVFQPWKLFVDTRVDEALPSTVPVATSPAGAPAGAPATAPAATPQVLAQGSFRSFEHHTTGSALLVRLPDGRVLVRLQDLVTSDGPDVHVWLASAPAGSEEAAFPPGHVELGKLKGNLGNQNYAVPAAVDATRYASVVIWCERFSVAFAAASLRA